MPKSVQKYHFIALGGSVMHSLAIDLFEQGHLVTGSDDIIFDPAKTRLQSKGLLPKTIGWDPKRITADIDRVVLGMHAQLDNPELLKAQEMKLRIVSFPELIYEMTSQSRRIVIAGSHGKTSITAMITKVLYDLEMDFDYALGALVPGISNPVKLTDSRLAHKPTDEKQIVIIEGDEYLSSRIDPKSKFLHYHPNDLVITGIAWDHVNVFPTFEDYLAPFIELMEGMDSDGRIIYCAEDRVLTELVQSVDTQAQLIPYRSFEVNPRDSILNLSDSRAVLRIFGHHNYQNLSAAWHISSVLGVRASQFCQSMSEFSGAAKRLQRLESHKPTVYLDYAHAPSKLLATLDAVKEHHFREKVLAIYELHTYSSMDAEFLKQYRGALRAADFRYHILRSSFCQTKAKEGT